MEEELFGKTILDSNGWRKSGLKTQNPKISSEKKKREKGNHNQPEQAQGNGERKRYQTSQASPGVQLSYLELRLRSEAKIMQKLQVNRALSVLLPGAELARDLLVLGGVCYLLFVIRSRFCVFPLSVDCLGTLEVNIWLRCRLRAAFVFRCNMF